METFFRGLLFSLLFFVDCGDGVVVVVVVVVASKESSTMITRRRMLPLPVRETR